MIEVSNIKVTIPLLGSALPRNILPPEGSPGSAKALVTVQVKSNNLHLNVVLKAKAYRDALAKVDASPHGAYVVVQGKLGPNSTITEAGITAVQPIVPKEELQPAAVA